jgi:hypothetical protein
MYIAIVVWDLSESTATVESLRRYLRDYAVDAFSTLKGMRLKTWFSNSARGIWGAVYLWDSPEYMRSPLTVSRSIALIGYPPTSVSVFEVEAVAEGLSAFETLTGVGRAFDTEPCEGIVNLFGRTS